VIDKLVLLCPAVRRGIESLVLARGERSSSYERCLDLRDTSLALPVRLYVRGRHNGLHKAELIGVATLGLPRTTEIAKLLFQDLRQVRIYRIDLCTDLLGIPPSFFLLNAVIPRRQNYALFRSRSGTSFYLEVSRQRRTLFYDRGRLLRKKRHALAKVFGRSQLTRAEIQMSGAAVPFRRFQDFSAYAEFDPLAGIRFMKLSIADRTRTPVKQLAAFGLRWLIRRHGQQATSRMFPSSAWSAIQKTYLRPMEASDIPAIRRSMRESTRRWLAGQILFPRAQ
jgi:hypothetical protein